jgi:hypothetical protein
LGVIIWTTGCWVPPVSPPTSHALEPKTATPEWATGTWSRPATTILPWARSKAQIVETVLSPDAVVPAAGESWVAPTPGRGCPGTLLSPPAR